MKKYEVEHYETSKIEELLLYRKIVKVDKDTLYLDNGVELEVRANEGCGGCSSGWYSIMELNGCENAITNVEFITETIGEYEDELSYKIFVLAADKRIKVLQVDGDDGNGYYGTGYSIMVTIRNERMPIKEAIRILSRVTSENTIRRLKFKYGRKEVIEMIEEAMDMGAEALKKQTPKPVGEWDIHSYGTPFYCPECEADITPVEFFRHDGSEPKEKVSYCWKCGQALRWGE